MRAAGLLMVALVASACLTRFGGPPQPRAEQFEFVPRPGSGVGAAAHSLVDGMGAVEGADHIATVATPLGDFRFVTFTGEGDMSCQALISSAMESVGCGPALEGGGIPSDEVRVLGTGLFDDWVLVEISAGSDVAAVTATADDGRAYRARMINGFGLIVHPVERGALSVQGFDASGQPIGEVVMTDAFVDQAPVPAP